MDQLAASIREDACRLFIGWTSDERLGASTSIWMYYESECDGLTCGTVVCTIAEDHSVEGHYTVKASFRHLCRDTGCAEGSPLEEIE
uniref:Uncharacterized protein n=1 Tax=Peronospora matthiolae TaxID=2874970 RepID=A0AAV1TQN4_9STRA